MSSVTPLHAKMRSRAAPALARRVCEHLDLLLASPHFDASARSREFLRFVVDETLAERGARLNQAAIAIAVFRRGADFDPILDPIVRVQAGRLRRSLERYYLLTGASDALRIELPKGSYTPQFVSTGLALEAAVQAPLEPAAMLPAAPSWPTLVLLSVRGEGEAAQTSAARLARALSDRLLRYDDVRGIHAHEVQRLCMTQRHATRFELDCVLQADSGGLAARVDLYDRAAGTRLWSEDYRASSAPDDSLDTAGSIARSIAARAGAEHGIIVRTLVAERPPRETAAGCNAVLHCRRFFLTQRMQDFPSALEGAQQLARREPHSALAWRTLARLLLADHSFELSACPAAIESAVGCAFRSVLLDPTAIAARCVLAEALLVQNELDAARAELDHALQLDGEHCTHRAQIGWLRALAGDWPCGMTLLRAAALLDPCSQPQLKHALWAEHLQRGEIEAAYLAALEYRGHGFFWRELMTTACLALLGRVPEARAGAAELLQLKPDFALRGHALISRYLKADALIERVIEGLRKAGLMHA